MFRYIRFQIVHPCRAQCSWCATHKKNPLFRRLVHSGASDQIHQFYQEVAAALKPREIFLSGGEPLLHPRIAPLLQELATHTERIHLFTSYQWSAHDLRAMPLAQLPLDKIVFNHTPIYFEPQRWAELTKGWPFETYVQNIQHFARLPARKRFKFIINHDGFADELARFQELIQPDERCELSLKVINDQGNGLTVPTMRETRERVHARLQELDALVKEHAWGRIKRTESSIDQMAPLLEHGDAERCVFRHEPIELRFALDPKVRQGKQVLRYRYCPYFPPSFGHRFHIGKDSLDRLSRNYYKGDFRSYCGQCRFLKNYRGEPACSAAQQAQP